MKEVLDYSATPDVLVMCGVIAMALAIAMYRT